MTAVAQAESAIVGDDPDLSIPFVAQPYNSPSSLNPFNIFESDLLIIHKAVCSHPSEESPSIHDLLVTSIFL